jgi:tetratricopeptide (TPR) repeat protein
LVLASIRDAFQWHWAAADKEYRGAIALSPNYATAHHWFSLFLTNMGRHDEAIEEADEAAKLDPLSPRGARNARRGPPLRETF